MVPVRMLTLLRWTTVGVGVLMVAGTLLSLSRNPHWLVRGWDFPRIQVAILASAAGGIYAWFFTRGALHDHLFLGAVLACVLWQAFRIYPYTAFAPKRVQRSRRPPSKEHPRIRILVANVLQDNPAHQRLLSLVREADPDILLAVETDEGWIRSLEPLAAGYPHTVRAPLDNYYGLALFSRLPLHQARVEFLVQDDIPSVFAVVELGGERVVLRGLHPRPPEPLKDQDSTPRDAELVLVGKAIAKQMGEPTIVVGDLNDVAWSATTQLFLRLSGLLDPRMGRGLYNTFNANNPLFRWPLDHIFHSNHFRLVELRRCRHIGSDHFPVLIELSFEPDAPAEQPESRTERGDHAEARERIEAQAEAAQSGDDRPGRE